LPTSTPGSVRCCAGAAANGLFAPSPSCAIRPVLGRVRHKRGLRRLDPSQPASNVPPRPGGPLDGRGERIVAAGVEYHHAQRSGSFDRTNHLIEPHRLQADIAVGLEPGVHRDQIVGPADLDAVAGIVDDRPVGVVRFTSEGSQSLCETVTVKIGGWGDIEAILPQRISNQLASLAGFERWLTF
jgi:hypothetical protein